MKILIKNFQTKIPIYPTRIKKTIRKVFSAEKLAKSGEITVCFVRDAKITQLNKKYHHRNSPTDVLAFDLTGAGPSGTLVGDIIVSTDTAVKNAKRYHTTPRYETELYVVHGILHLLGFSDHSAKQASVMRTKEKKYVHS